MKYTNKCHIIGNKILFNSEVSTIMSSVHRTKSLKGFVALDLDGTTMVQKFDKNLFFGWSNPDSHIRQTIIEYARMAQKQGYDLLILTARPSLVEPVLEGVRVGTKPTNEIIKILKKHGIKIRRIERTPAGLKGNTMLDLLKEYREGGAPDAVGMIFEDQLKQINDVNSKKSDHLAAYDINSKADLEEYIKRIRIRHGRENPFHPQNIIKQILEPDDKLKRKGAVVTEESKKLIALKNRIDSTNQARYSDEIELIKDIMNDLCIRLYETQYRHYTPEILWVSNVTTILQLLMEKIATNPMQITHNDIETACNTIFGSSSLSKIQPNSNCDASLNKLLDRLSRFPLVNDIKKQCTAYQMLLSEIVHNKKPMPSDESSIAIAKEQLNVVGQLLDCLDLSKTNDPTTSLETFSTLFLDNKGIFKKSKGGNEWYESIRLILVQIPLLGYLFQTKEENLLNTLEDSSLFFLSK